MAMIRKQIYIEKEQDDELKRLAALLGVTEAEIVRRALQVMTKTEGQKSEEVTYTMSEQKYLNVADRDAHDSLEWSRADIYKGANRRLDDDAWAEELEFIEEIGRTAAGNEEPLKWSRDDAYDKRRLRLPD